MSILVLLDFSKAFDTISHQLLCAKLKYFGFCPSSLSLVSSYLHERSQTISINNAYSSSLNIFSGVPQGSILGPLFFIIYTSDILTSVRNGQVQAFADDTQIYFSFYANDSALANHIINNELNNIQVLALEHDLKLNSSKSSVMLFGNKKHASTLKNELNILIDGVTLPFVDSAKNLGLIIDTDLRFKEHVKKLMQKSFYSLKLLYSNRHILNFKLRIKLCDSLVLSHFNYCDFIYGPCLDVTDKNRIQKVQNTCCRLIYGLRKYDRVSQKINDINWLRMDNRRLHHLGNFVHGLQIMPYSSRILKRKFVSRSSIHNRNVREKNKFTLPQHRTAMFQRSFIYNSIKLYNSLSLIHI